MSLTVTIKNSKILTGMSFLIALALGVPGIAMISEIGNPSIRCGQEVQHFEVPQGTLYLRSIYIVDSKDDTVIARKEGFAIDKSYESMTYMAISEDGKSVQTGVLDYYGSVQGKVITGKIEGKSLVVTHPYGTHEIPLDSLFDAKSFQHDATALYQGMGFAAKCW